MKKEEKDFLKEHNLFESYKRFNKIANVKEYTFAANGKDLLLDEDEDEENDIPNDSANIPSDIPDDTITNGETPIEGTDTIPDETATNDVNQEELPVEQPPVDDIETPIDSEPEMPIEEPESEDVVVDISDLTSHAEETDEKITNLDSKLDNMVNQISSKVDNILAASNQAMEDIKKEIEKRNPTNIEKLQMRTANNYPFNVTPDNYWRNKEQEGTYKAQPEEEEYVLKTSDVTAPISQNQFRSSLYNESELNIPTKLSEILK